MGRRLLLVIPTLLSRGGAEAWVQGGGSIPTFVEESTEPWMCHHYTGNQQETNFCATAGIQGDVKYLYTEGGVGSPCFPCWCCEQRLQSAGSSGGWAETLTTGSLSTVSMSTPWPAAAPSESPTVPPPPTWPAAVPSESPTVPPPPATPLGGPLYIVTAAPPAIAPGLVPFPTAIAPAPLAVPAGPGPAAAAEPQLPEDSDAGDGYSSFAKQAIAISGVSPAVLAGEGGSVEADRLTIRHNAGFSLFSEYDGEWAPEGIAQLKLLGKAISFDVDLSRVGCACNLAFYLVSSPARGKSGKPSMGTNRGGQPPYYCDANQVGGQWCPEVDIMEANAHAFQATPHKCDAPKNGHYSNCDRGGCSENTRDQADAYGPGSDFAIDTRRPFEVRTEFPAASGELRGMRTMLRQSGKQVTLAHTSCSADYFTQLSDAMAAGMSLRITYWGDSAETMSWMDSPPCGQEACTGARAGHAVISNITVGTLAEPEADHGKRGIDKWVVSDPSDDLFKTVVPNDIVEDPTHFVSQGDMGVAEFQHASHLLQRVNTETDMEDLVRDNHILRRYEQQPPRGAAESAGSMKLLSIVSFSAAACATAAAVLCLARRLRPADPGAPLIRRSESGELVTLEAAFDDPCFSDGSDCME